MNLLLGPNNSGKSLALQEIESWARGVRDDPTWRVIEAGAIDPAPSIGDLTGFLEAVAIPKPRAEVGRDMESNSIVYYLPSFGMSGPNPQNPAARIDLGTNPELQEPWIGDNQDWIRAQILNPLTTRLDGQTRLNMSTPRDAVDLRDPAVDHISALLRDDRMRSRVQAMAREAFGGWLLIDPTRTPKLSFVIADREPPPDIERQMTDEAIKFFDNHTTALSEFSDGVRAYIGLLAGVASLPAALVLIDEPDAFLHPPLARRLGRNVAVLTEERGGQLFAATHSADFTMGCLEVSADPRVLRLNYSDGRASARVLDRDDLAQLTRQPLLRSTSALRGPFHRAAVLVEGDSDRVFYEEINRRLSDSGDEGAIDDALFLHTQGWQTLPRVSDPLSRLGVPAAMILDFDALRQDGAQWRPFLRRIPDDGRRAKVASHRGTAAALMEKLIANGEVAKSGLKERGVNALPVEHRGTIDRAIMELAEFGICVVPVGEVESWLPELQVPRRKDRWTERMLDRLGADPSAATYVRPSNGDVWNFVRTIASWISLQAP